MILICMNYEKVNKFNLSIFVYLAGGGGPDLQSPAVLSSPSPTSPYRLPPLGLNPLPPVPRPACVAKSTRILRF